MNTLVPALAFAQAAEERSLTQTMIAALPKDPASLVMLALVVVVVVVIVVYGRKSGGEERDKK